MAFKFQIRARFSGTVLFEVELDAKFESASEAVKLGEAVKAAYLCDANLRGANLGDANLGDAYLGGANLGGANLGGANLRGANLRDAYLGGANLGGANLGDAYLGGANLGDANLGDANLGGANLGGANLRGANLRDANLRDANLRDANLDGAKIGEAAITALITRVTRTIDPYEFLAFATDTGVIIRAGCRTMSPAEFRAHVAAEYPGTPKAEETLAILEFIEARAAVVCQAATAA